MALVTAGMVKLASYAENSIAVLMIFIIAAFKLNIQDNNTTAASPRANPKILINEYSLDFLMLRRINLSV